MSLAKIELDVPRNTTDEQDVKAIETGDNLGLTDQLSNEPQESCKDDPVDQQSPGLTDHQTSEPQNSGQGLKDQLISKQQDSELIGPGQIDPQTGEPVCNGSFSPIDNESPGLRDQESSGSDSNEHAGPEDKTSSNLADKKTVEPDVSKLSGAVDQGCGGMTDQKSSESQGIGLYG